MKPGLLITAFLVTVYATSGHAMSPEAEAGKALYPACNVCHDQALKPPLGPPMWGVQRLYKQEAGDKEAFVRQIVDFVKAPGLEKAIHKEAVEQLGLMPPMPLPDDLLKQIVTYIWEERFPPPCDHWRVAVKRAEERGDAEHAAKDRRQLQRYCQ
ncbi:MAG: hypothetical protein Kow006_00030 [Gammaproteobacteria bacterium]